MDHRSLAPYFAEHLPDLGALRSVTQFAQGQSNPTYALDFAHGRAVLRTKPPGVLLKSAHAVEREARVMQALAATGVPVPGVLLVHEGTGGPLGRSFFVMAHVEGRILWDPALPGMTPDARAAHCAAMGAALAALHAVDPAAVGLGDFGKPGTYFARQIDRWTRQYAASTDAPDPRVTALAQWLAAHQPPDDGAVALVHGDYRLDNMIFAADRAQIVAVLDWELSTLGHPMADIAYQCMQWRLPHDSAMPGLGGLDRAALGLPSEAAYLADYCALRGVPVPPAWPFYLAFAFFRLIAILAGVQARAAAGTAANPTQARRIAGVIPLLIQGAQEVLHD